MAIPVIKVPTFELNVPSMNKQIKCRPYCVKEEKVLLMAMESESEEDMLSATKQILNNCIVDSRGIDIEELAMFDIEYIFMKLRAKSKGEKLYIAFRGLENSECEDCKKPKKIEIDLNSIEVTRDPKHVNKIKLTEDVGVIMQYPKYGMLEALSYIQAAKNPVEEVEVAFRLIESCIKTIYDKESLFETKEANKDEIKAFVESLTSEQFEKVFNFFVTMPRIQMELDLGCKTCGREDKQTLTGVKSFFQ